MKTSEPEPQADTPAGRTAPGPIGKLRREGLRPVPLAATLLFALGSALVGLAVGPVDLPLGSVLREVASHVPLLGVHSSLGATQAAILWQIRAPRVVLGLLVGGTLALAGGAYQGTFRNPLADPYLLGVAAGAGLGATVAITLLSSNVGSTSNLVPVAAFVGALGAVALTYGVAAGGPRAGTVSLLLAGVAVAGLLTAAQTFLQQRNTQALQNVYVWLLGSLASAQWHDVIIILPYVAVCVVVVVAHGRLFDVLSVGDLEASSLGVPVTRVRLTVIVAASLGTAAVVSVSGLIGFVGIIIPHTIRLLVGTSYRVILPLSFCAGAGFMVLTDVLARTVLSPAELPIGVVTAAIGAPFFVVVLRTRQFRGL